jgi:shikimate kinase
VSEPWSGGVVVVIGMMGAGKTTVGRELANLLGVPAVDSDDLISKRCGMSAAEQLRKSEADFRRFEAEEIVHALRSDRPMVLSVGGGAPVTSAVAEALSGHTPVVWIKVPEDELFRRISAHANDRPSLDGDPRQRMHHLLQTRGPAYESAADVIVDGVGSPEVVAHRILGAIK